MGRYTSGWIKIHRNVLDQDVSTNICIFGLWNVLLVMASWQRSEIIWDGKKRTLPPGSVIIGNAELAKRLNCSKQTILKWLKYLNDNGRIVIEASTRGTLVTICHWENFQSDDALDEGEKEPR